MNGLTPRQVQMLRLVQQGLSNREIGERLTMTPGSVNVALGRIYKQLGVASRTAAIYAAVRAGLIKPICPGCKELRAANRELRTQISQQNRAIELLEADTLDDMRHALNHAGADR